MAETLRARSKWIRKCPHCRALQHLDIVPALGFECWSCGEATTYRPGGIVPIPEFRPFYNRFGRGIWGRALLLLMIPIFAATYWNYGPLRFMAVTMMGVPYYWTTQQEWCDFGCPGDGE